MESSQYQFPHWNDKPPEGFPIHRSILESSKKPNFQQVEPLASMSDIQDVFKSGNQLLESGEDIEALWKFENCLLICEQNQPCSQEDIAKYTTSCTMTTMKILTNFSELEKLKLLLLCDMYCKLCFERVHEASLLEKPHYWRGESLRLQNEWEDALQHFIESYQVTHSPSALSKIILLKGVTTRDLLKSFNFQKNLTELIELLLNSEEISIPQIECLIKFSKQTNPKKFGKAIRVVPSDISKRLLKFCQTKIELLQELITLLSYNEDQAANLIEEVDDINDQVANEIDDDQDKVADEVQDDKDQVATDQGTNKLDDDKDQVAKDDKDQAAINEITGDQLLCCHLLDIKQLRGSKKLMKKFTSASRTWYLCKVLQNNNVEQALSLLESGDVIPEKVDLSKQTKKVLQSRELLSALLAKKVDPCGSSSPTPIIQLVQSCPKQINKKKSFELYCKIIENIYLLLAAGAEVKDLNTYHKGHETTPLHVATEMAVIAGKIDILETVHALWKGDTASTDGKGMTCLHILATMKAPPIYTKEVWKFLVCSCNVDISVHDSDSKMAVYYLLPKTKKLLKTKDIPYQVTEEVKPSSIHTEEQPLDLVPKLTKRAGPQTEQNSFDDKDTAQASDTEGQNNDEESDATTQMVILTEKEVKKRFKKLFSKPDSHFLEEQHNSTVEDSSQQEVATLASNSTEMHKPNRASVTLPFDPESADCKWEVEVSEYFRKQLRDESVSTKAVLTTIRKLAEGYFDFQSMKKLKSKRSTPAIYEARVNDTVRLLYALLDRFSEKDTANVRAAIRKQIYVYKKTIVVLDIVPKHEYITQHAEHALNMISNESEKKLEVLKDKGTLDARSLPQLSLRCDSQKITDEERETIKKLLNTNAEPLEGRRVEHISAKMYSLTISVVCALLDEESEKGDYPIKVTDDEFDIIEKSSKQPVAVLGRSGTGKTTVCLCKLWKIFKEYWGSDDRLQNPLIPKTQYLKFKDLQEKECYWNVCKSTDHNFATSGSSFDSSTPENSFSGDPDQLSLVVDKQCEHIHQVFITKSGKLCEQMKQRFHEFVAQHGFAQKHKEFIKKMKKLPKTLTELDELCFPVFLTARQFFLMLDKSLRDDQEYFQDDEIIITTEQQTSSKLETLHEIWRREEEDGDQNVQLKRVEVTASYFQKYIWPKLEKHFREKVDPFLIWMEIQSYIKGSLQALQSKGGILSEEAYKDFGTKRAPNFPVSRVEVYTTFKEYNHHLKHKDIGKRLFDNGDFIYQLYTRLIQKVHLQNWSLHYVYIDEVQDFTQAELSLIIRCCRHPNGFFFAGDTAQTIIKGIAFRFEDLDSVFHSFGEESKVEESKPLVNLPERSMLTLNHRSHSGITSLATTVTDLLQHFFNEYFDWRNIPKDESSVGDGPEPLFLCCDTPKLSNSFIKLNKGSKESVQFGANQVVIVRETEQLNNLPAFLSEAIILTIQQCKGLEFNDVLLYNFFTNFIEENDGATKEIWRASATYLKDKQISVQAPYTQKGVHPLKYDERLHKTLCAELKYLYTVITRAKSHLWIYESESPEELPMLDYWHRRGVVKVVTDAESESIKEQLREVSLAKSTQADWKKRGDELCELELWEKAIECYQKAGESVLEKQAQIQILHREATSIKHTNREHYLSVQRTAATAHLECDELHHDIEYLKSAAICLRLAKMYPTAAKLFEKLNENKKALKIYGTILHDVANYIRLKEELGDFTDAIIFACDEREFETARQLTSRYMREEKLQQHELEKIASEIISKLLKNDGIGETEVEKEVKEWLHFIPDIDEFLNLKKSRGNYKETFKILCIKKEFNKALRLATAQKMFTEGIELAKETGNNRIVTELQLQHATQRIFRSKRIETTDTSLHELSRDENLITAAKAKLLLAMDRNFKGDHMALCQKACNIYEQEQNTVGEIECFHILRVTIADLSLPQLTEHILRMISKAEQLKRAAHNKSRHGENVIVKAKIKEIKQFYGIKSAGSGQSKRFFMPTTQYLWFDKQHSDLRLDIDGMVELDRQDPFSVVRTHINRYITEWLKPVKSALKSEGKSKFPFYTGVKRLKYLRSTDEHSEMNNLQEYIKHCELESRVYRVGKQIAEAVYQFIQLLSPFSQILITLTKEICTSIASSTHLRWALEKKIDTLLSKESKNITCDTWLKAWQLFSILSLTQASWSEQQTDTLLHKRYPYEMEKCHFIGSRDHYFSFWVKCCKLLRSGRFVHIAIQNSLNYFVYHAVSYNTDDNIFISSENLVSILSIHTTVLLIMLSHSYSKQGEQDRIIPIPGTFQRFMQTFHLTNCHGKPDIGVRRACLETAKTMDAATIQTEVRNILAQFLLLLIKESENGFSPVKITIRKFQQQPEDTIHCLVLTLTIIGNLALMLDEDPRTNNLLQRAYEEILQYIDINTSSTSELLQDTCKNLEACQTAQDLFQSVVNKLLADSFGMNVMRLKIANQEKGEQVEFIECQCEKIPEIPIREQQFYQHPPQSETATNIGQSYAKTVASTEHGKRTQT